MGGYIPDEIIEEIRVRSDIVEVISERILLKKSGANYKGICPFHTEKTPSFSVSPSKQIFHCFGCNTGGNVYNFIMKIENIPFVDAIKYLAKRYGINIPQHEEKGINSSNRNTLFEVNELVADFFHKQLYDSPGGKVAMKYLKGRAINEKTISLFRIGYALPSGDGIQHFLNKKGIPNGIQNLAGLIKDRDSGGYVDRFRDRVIFPISDTEGRVVGFGGRVLNDEDSRPKYLNSPETPVYKKGDILYGLHITKDSIREKRDVFLVEGYFDLITTYQEGIKNIIATSGTALTENHVKVLRRYADTVTLVFDGDEAGKKASERGGITLSKGGMKVKVMPLLSEKDPDSFIKEVKSEGFLNTAKDSKPFMEYIIDRVVAESNIKTVSGKTDCIKRVLPFLSAINSLVEKSLYISLIAGRVGVYEKAVVNELNKELNTTSYKFSAINPEPRLMVKSGIDSRNRAEKILVQLMLLDDKNINKIKKYISADDFNDRDMAKVTSVLFTLSDGGDKITVAEVMDLLSEDKLKDTVSELAFEDIEYQDVDKNILDCIKYIKRSRIDVKDIIHRLKKAVLEGDRKEFKELQLKISKSREKEYNNESKNIPD